MPDDTNNNIEPKINCSMFSEKIQSNKLKLLKVIR